MTVTQTDTWHAIQQCEVWDHKNYHWLSQRESKTTSSVISKVFPQQRLTCVLTVLISPCTLRSFNFGQLKLNVYSWEKGSCTFCSPCESNIQPRLRTTSLRYDCCTLSLPSAALPWHLPHAHPRRARGNFPRR